MIAAAGFRLRSIRTSLTLGDKLKKVREKRRLSLFEVEEATKIRAKYIHAIERGDYEALPTGAYPRGFVFSYASYLGMPESQVLVDWQKECRLVPLEPKIRTERSVTLSRFVITPRLILTTTAICAGFLIVTYLLYQVGHVTSGPELVVEQPAREALVSDDHLQVSGYATRGTAVSINGQVVQLDGQGRFEEQVHVEPGLNSVEVSAKDSAGKQSTSVRLVERREEVSTTGSTPALP